MGQMLPFGLPSLPLPDLFSMHTHPMNFAVLQLLLAIPVLYCGRNFFINGFKALFHSVIKNFALNLDMPLFIQCQRYIAAIVHCRECCIETLKLVHLLQLLHKVVKLLCGTVAGSVCLKCS